MKSICFNISISIIFLLTIFLSPVQTAAQSIPERRADKFYKNWAYSNAVELYEGLYQKDSTNVKYIERLAFGYYKMLNFKKAKHFYDLLIQKNQLNPASYYDYVQLLLINGDKKESDIWLDKYNATLPVDERARIQLKSDSIPIHSKLNPENIEIKNLESNSEFTDMCPAYYHDRIVYSSAKAKSSIFKRNYRWNNEPFLDLYISQPDSGKTHVEDVRLSSSINSKFHEGPVCFNSRFNKIFFTRNNYLNGKVKTNPDGVNNLKIFIADFDGKECVNIQSFPYNSDSYSVGYPSLSPDDSTLYFVSDMHGGFGETDLYKSELINGVWSKPVNLGEPINTKEKENFPFVQNDSIFYFSSNRQGGLGGLDIYEAKKGKIGNYSVFIIDSPFNSSYDDFGCVIKKDALIGYFTSNRPNGKGEDDIYSFVVNKIDLCVKVYEDQTKKILPQSKVALIDENGKILDTRITDRDGTAKFLVKPGVRYQLTTENTSHIPEIREIKIKSSMIELVQKEDIYLKRGFPYLTIQIIDQESGLAIPNATIDIYRGKYDQKEVKKRNGELRMRLNESTEYTFHINSKGYIPNTTKFSSVNKPADEYHLTIELEKFKEGKQFVLEDLFYDFDKYNIRPDAALVLNKLVNILEENPEIRIEIGSHTDSRAAKAYNLKLSQNRSKSVVSYLISKKIDSNRLVAKGYGESQLVNKCADGVKCTEAEHQANRRTVIKILNSNIKKVKSRTYELPIK